MEVQPRLLAFPYDICDEEGVVVKTGTIKAYSFDRALIIFNNLREEIGETSGGFALGCIPIN